MIKIRESIYQNKQFTRVRKPLLVLLGLGLGQLFPFFIVPTPTWMIIDKILFGVGIGVGIAGLLVYIDLKINNQ